MSWVGESYGWVSPMAGLFVAMSIGWSLLFLWLESRAPEPEAGEIAGERLRRGLAAGAEPDVDTGVAKAPEEIKLSLTQTANAFYPEDPDDEHLRFAAQQQSYVFNHWLMRALVTGELDVDLDRKTDNVVSNPPEGYYEELHGRIDFVGVQYYGPVVVRRDPLLEEMHPLYARPLLDVRDYDETLPHNGMGREISAAGFKDTLWLYATWGLPILLSENGTTTNLPPAEVSSDGGPSDAGPEEDAAETGAFAPEQAAMYLAEHLWEVGNALEAGVDIRGYFHWTLADNFEWVEGHRQRFGAYSVDFDDPERPRTLNAMGEALRDIVLQLRDTSDAIAAVILYDSMFSPVDMGPSLCSSSLMSLRPPGSRFTPMRTLDRRPGSASSPSRRFLLVDRNARVGDSWRQRFDSLTLFTPRAYSALPGMPLEAIVDGRPCCEVLLESTLPACRRRSLAEPPAAALPAHPAPAVKRIWRWQNLHSRRPG